MLLIVDDDGLTCRALSRVFGPGTEAASTIEEGIRLAEKHQPRAIILDVSMGNENGIDAIPSLLRASPGSCVIVFTARTSSAMRDLALSAGAVSYIHKIHIDRIDEIVDDVLSSDRSRTRAAAAAKQALH